jgi:2TM domain
MNGEAAPDPVASARARAKALADLLWHVGAFVIINAFFWLIDLTLGDPGADWAFWITAVWGLGLAFHVLSYLIAGRQLVERATQKYLDQDAAAGRRVEDDP